MNSKQLIDTARTMVGGGEGLLVMAESNPITTNDLANSAIEEESTMPASLQFLRGMA